jgi:hypothetical protein
MKAIYLVKALTFFLFCSLQGFGQTVITYASHAPFIGYVSTHMTFESFSEPINIDPGPEGAGQTWDFSAFTATEEFQVEFINPANTPFADQLDGTDINIAVASIDAEGGGFSFLHVSSSELAIRAFGATEDGEPVFWAMFDPSPVIFQYPFAFGNSFETQGQMEYTIEGFTTVQSMYSTSYADAWGTVITPLGTYPNALRIRTVSVDSIKMYVAGVLIYEEGYTTHEYLWYSQAHRMMVYEILGEYDEEFLPWSYSYLKSETVLVDEIKHASINIYPNPTSGFIIVEHSFQEDSPSFRLMDISGRVVLAATANGSPGRIQLDVTNFPKGMYVLQMISNSKAVESRKIVIQ